MWSDFFGPAPPFAPAVDELLPPFTSLPGALVEASETAVGLAFSASTFFATCSACAIGDGSAFFVLLGFVMLLLSSTFGGRFLSSFRTGLT